jgi:hypothetical protein
MNRKLLTAGFVLAAGVASLASAQVGANDNAAAIGANRPAQRRGDGINERLMRNRARNEELSNTLAQRAPFSAHDGWGDYGYYHSYRPASTAMGDVMRGAAEGIRATGEAVRNGSEAAVNLGVAKKLYIENDYQAAETYFEKRRLWAENNAYMRGAPLSQEQLRQIARDAAPERLSILQLHPMTGDINWPAALLRPEFEQARMAVEDVFTNRTVSNTGMGSTTESAVARLTRNMQARLLSQLRDDELTTNEYLAAKSFLRSLAHETRFIPGVEGIAQR